MTRTHVVMADEVLEAINEVVGERGRSRFIEEAAREKLDRAALADAIRSTSGILTARAYPHWRDRRAIKAWVRKMRRREKS